MPENPIRHDYTRGTERNGWGVISFEFLDVGKVKMSAFGLKSLGIKASREESFLLPGEEIVISMPDGTVLYEITKIRYHLDPYDMYDAELKYIQHLTGWKIVGQMFDETKEARQLEWSRQRFGDDKPKA